MKRDTKFDELLDRLRHEDDASDSRQPMRLVLRVGEQGLELTEQSVAQAEMLRLFPRVFELTLVPGPDTVQ